MEKELLLRGGCLARIQGLYPSLTKSARKVAEYILEHPDEVMRLTCKELGAKCGTSEATVVRLCQSLGYEGYLELRTAITPDLMNLYKTPYEELKENDDGASILKKVFQINIQALEDTLSILDPKEYEKAVQRILSARRVEFYGLGGARTIAENAELTFLRLNILARASVDPVVQLKSANLLEEGDVAVGISHSGENLVHPLRIAQGKGATTICITNNPASPITEVSDICLITGARRLLLGAQAGPSRIVQMSVIDALAAGVVLWKYHYEK